MNQLAISDAAIIRQELRCLEASSIFSRSGNLFSLLRFVVEESLAGRGETLKELVIGDALYGKQQPYDPRIDSTVRVEARRLRRKLDEYYRADGASRPIRIELPTGGYRPLFRDTPVRSADGVPNKLRARTSTASVDLAILPFRALSAESEDHRFADGLTDDVIYACGALPGLRVAPRLVVFQYKNRSYSVAEVASELGAALVLHGTIRAEPSRSRVTIEISDPQGFVAWSDRVEFLSWDSIGEQEKLAGAIARRIPVGIAQSVSCCSNSQCSAVA
ncbi:hypothetical protein [Bradyrhizobium sp. 33ap4]|uniref:hypothetical protein n=1 Tax=Bradyrhizobium sp. 33ap4 TaxID=3061630 RepID=UPI002930E249|nr:hypothetical protein [Bradyrhizobium sp. 33ap4]